MSDDKAKAFRLVSGDDQPATARDRPRLIKSKGEDAAKGELVIEGEDELRTLIASLQRNKAASDEETDGGDDTPSAA